MKKINIQINILFFFNYLTNTLLRKGKYKTIHKKMLNLFLYLKYKLTVLNIYIFQRIFFLITPFLKLVILKKKKKRNSKSEIYFTYIWNKIRYSMVN